VTIKLSKTPCGWIDRPRTPNLRHQTSDPNAALSFSCCLLFVFLGSYVVAIWQSDFCLLFKLIKISLLSMGAVQTYPSSVLNGNVNSV